MPHPSNTKNKYKAINEQFNQMAKIITQLSNLFLVMEGDIRELKETLAFNDIKAEEKKVALEKVEEPTDAKTEDYFPKKEETDVEEVVNAK